MKKFSHFPQYNGSRRFYHDATHFKYDCEQALAALHAQASIRAPQPAQPTIPSPMLSAKVSPYQQWGSNSPSAAPSVPLAQTCPPNPWGHLNAWMLIGIGASTPLSSPCHCVKKGVTTAVSPNDGSVFNESSA
jgi:hypothetical protein